MKYRSKISTSSAGVTESEVLDIVGVPSLTGNCAIGKACSNFNHPGLRRVVLRKKIPRRERRRETSLQACPERG
jgi:hypothetical protein